MKLHLINEYISNMNKKIQEKRRSDLKLYQYCSKQAIAETISPMFLKKWNKAQSLIWRNQKCNTKEINKFWIGE